MAASYAHNQWYVVATSIEVADKPLARTVCGEPLVLFRDRLGAACVLIDRCPHRKAPLSEGNVQDGDLACGYHGVRFNGTGACTFIPGGIKPRAGFHARCFPSRELYGLIFVWFGDAAAANPSLIPDLHKLVSTEWKHVSGMMHIAANYQLLMDNTLDLTHVMFLHKSTLGGSGVADFPLEVDVRGDVLHARRVMYNVDSPPIFQAARGLHGKIDRWQIFEFRPTSYILVTLGARAAGSDEPIGTATHLVYTIFTPESETSTFYFWFVIRNWALEDDSVSEMYRILNQTAFDEDKHMVELQQLRISADTSGAPLLAFPFDQSAMLARKIIRSKIAEELGTPDLSME